MTDSLLQKYEELYGNPEKYKSPSNSYTKNDSTIAILEALLEDLKSGRAIITSIQTYHNSNHLNEIPHYSSDSLNYTPLPIETGDLIGIDIFRKYV